MKICVGNCFEISLNLIENCANNGKGANNCQNVLNYEKISLKQHFGTQKVRYYSIFELPRNRRGGPLRPMGVVHNAPPG